MQPLDSDGMVSLYLCALWYVMVRHGMIVNPITLQRGDCMSYYRYNPSRGGHAPGHIRDAFLEWLDDGGPFECEHDSKGNPIFIDAEGESHSIPRLIGLLWNCSDIMPGSYCATLDLSQGSTYARGVRMIRAEYEL